MRKVPGGMRTNPLFSRELVPEPAQPGTRASPKTSSARTIIRFKSAWTRRSCLVDVILAYGRRSSMSMMTSFFVAPAAELPTSKLNEGVPAAFPSVLCDFLDDVKVAILEHLLTAKDP